MLKKPTERKLIFKRPAGGRGRGRSALFNTEDEIYKIGANQFFAIYSDGSKKVRNIKIDYNDYTASPYPIIKMNIAENISRLRENQGISQGDLAMEAGVSRQYIFQIENCEKNISLEALSRIADALGVNVEFLIRENSFYSRNLYIDKLVSELNRLSPERSKTICAEIIERLWTENQD